MIWTLGDFNSVYLLTGGGPADLTHVLATLGIRYLRLDQVDMSMASIVCAPAAGPAAGLFHDEAAVEMRPRKLLRGMGTEAALLLIGIPVLLWTMIPIYHMFLFAISPKDAAFSGQLWPERSDLSQFRDRARPAASLPQPFLAAAVQFAGDRARHGGAHAVRGDGRRLLRSAGCG